MSAVTLHELNQRFVRLTDRCRSQWTFYQLLQGLFKHLQNIPCPIEIDFPALFGRLREVSEVLAHPEAQRTEKTIAAINGELERYARSLLEVDAEVSPSLLRRFFDRLRTQDEKVLLAIIKFYIDSAATGDDVLDKLDLLFTRLAEIPRVDGGSLVRERHEIERIVQPLLQYWHGKVIPDEEIEILLSALTDIKSEAMACRSFSELVSGGILDRFRTLKRRLGQALLHQHLLPAVLETTVTIKNQFRRLFEDEEAQILDDTSRVKEMRRQLAAHPEMASQELRDALETFPSVQQRFDEGRQADNLRREDVVQLRRTLNLILEQFDLAHVSASPFTAPPPPHDVAEDVLAESEWDNGSVDALPRSLEDSIPLDPLLAEYLSKIVFSVELVGRDRSPEDTVHAKELVTLRLEPWEVRACRTVADGHSRDNTLTSERDRLFLNGAALRIRMDEEAREIDRLQRRGSDRLSDLLEHATQSLQRASEMEKRFQWFIDDALYRGDTELLEPLYRSRFRLLRAYSGLWLIHNERGGTSPL